MKFKLRYLGQNTECEASTSASAIPEAARAAAAFVATLRAMCRFTFESSESGKSTMYAVLVLNEAKLRKKNNSNNENHFRENDNVRGRAIDKIHIYQKTRNKLKQFTSCSSSFGSHSHVCV